MRMQPKRQRELLSPHTAPGAGARLSAASRITPALAAPLPRASGYASY